MSGDRPDHTEPVWRWLMRPAGWTPLQWLLVTMLALLGFSMLAHSTGLLPEVSDFLAYLAVALLGIAIMAAAYRRLVPHG